MKNFSSGQRVISASSGKSGRVVARSDGDRIYVKFDDRSYGELPKDQLKKADKK